MLALGTYDHRASENGVTETKPKQILTHIANQRQPHEKYNQFYFYIVCSGGERMVRKELLELGAYVFSVGSSCCFEMP